MLLFASCSPNPELYRKLFPPVRSIVQAGPIFQVQIQHPSSVSVGDVFKVTAEAKDENARTVKADITWEIRERDADKLELLQTEGKTIEIRALATGSPVFINAYANGEEGTAAFSIE